MTAEDLAVVRRFATALPAEPYGGPILRVLNELEELQGMKQRAGDMYRHGTGHTSAIARVILGAAS